MQEVPTQKAREGTTLARPVLDRKGRILLPAGATLTPQLVRCLGRWHIPSVFVETPEAPPPETQTETTERSSLFAPHVDSPEMMLIRRALDRFSNREE